MADCRTVEAKYVFLDIVGYTYNRSIEAQVHVIDALNAIVKKHIDALPVQQYILLPTGDGMCIGIIGAKEFDTHIQLASSILDDVYLDSLGINESLGIIQTQHQFELRIGVNQNVDNLVTDINGRPNLAGDGINTAQRIMSTAEPGKIMVSQSVYDMLNQRQKYMGKFKRGEFPIKHGKILVAYEYQYDPAKELAKRQEIKESLFGRQLFDRVGEILGGGSDKRAQTVVTSSKPFVQTKRDEGRKPWPLPKKSEPPKK